MIDCTQVIEFAKEKVKLLTSYQALVSNRCDWAFGRSSGRTELYYINKAINDSCTLKYVSL